MKRITIKEIAKRAGVSVGTVDRAFHDRGEVAQSTKELILKIAAEGNYITNVNARALKLNQTFQISIIIPQDNDYWLTLKEGIEIAAKEYRSMGIEVRFFKFERNSKDTFVEQSNLALSSNPDAIILAPLLEKEAKTIANQLNKKSIPFVLVDSNLKDAKPLAFIGQDTVQSGYLSAKLLNFGCPDGHHSVILKYTDYDIWNKTVKERIEGFKKYYSDRNWSLSNVEEIDIIDESSLLPIKEKLSTDSLLHIFVPNSRAYQVVEWLQKSEIHHLTRVLGYDQISANVTALKNDQIDFIINQNPIQQGFLSLQTLYRHLILKETVPSMHYMPVEIVTKENELYSNKSLK